MATPTFNGSAVFGTAFYSFAVANPHRIQWNAYNALNGRERLALGSSGVRVEFPEFTAELASEAALAAYENFFLDLVANATVGTLVDTINRTWPKATLITFEPISEVGRDGNGYFRSYRTVFEVG